jgi:Rod binding domain-containing protein
MTSVIHAPASGQQSPGTVPPTSIGTAAPRHTPTGGESRKLDDATRQFEAVFLRQMLSSLERVATTQGKREAGGNLYGSMLVDAVADAISRAGGIGIASMLKHSLEPAQTLNTTVEALQASSPADKDAANIRTTYTDAPTGSAVPEGATTREAGLVWP